MKLANDKELENTRRKLFELEALMADKEAAVVKGPAHDAALRGMRRFADKLRAEITEYEQAHQRA